jgi:small subunit ribosomal protein S9
VAAGSNSPEAFGELLASSGISEDDLDSLIALKDFSGIVGLPPLELIEEQDEEMEKKAMRREIERRKQEEIDKSRVKKVDALGRAYATGKRKTSIARVWLMEGEGKFIINGMSHDLYFPNLDNRVHYLEPFVQTKTLGAFDFRSTVKGGGTTGNLRVCGPLYVHESNATMC